MSSVAEHRGTYSAAFDRRRRDRADEPEFLRRAREAAFDRFAERGFPTTREEEWRFTNVAPIAAVPFEPAPGAHVSADDLASLALGTPGGYQIVLVNGHFASARLPHGVTVRKISDLQHANPADLGLLPAAVTPPPDANPFVDLNAAFFEDVVVVDVAAKSVVADPIQFLHLAQADATPVMASPRIVVNVGEAAEVSFVETYAGSGDGVTFTNAVTHVRVGARAIVHHVKLQREPTRAFHLQSLFVRLDRAATFTSHAITTGGALTRNDILARLDGEGAECTLNGLYLADGDSLVDTHTTIDHAQPHCPSHEVYKGILSGRSRAVFNGKIIVRQVAQKTDAKQTNKALLLTADAQVNTKPQLEIFADDVKCTHGAAIGQLDEDALFYLRARGIGLTDARALLIHAFAGEVIDGIQSPVVREHAYGLLAQKLARA